MTVLRADHLTKIYSPRSRQPIRALSDFSLEVHQGEIFGLLGPNGAGKTTFIKVLLSIASSTSGSAWILDHPIGTVPVKAFIGYLPENHKYPSYLSGEDVLKYFGRLSGIQKEALVVRISTVLRLVGMEQWRSVKIRKYSKGMMQRLGLAQALLNEPRLVFLDEPTDGVDPLGRKDIRDILVRLKDEGRTVFLNSHLLSEVELICDRVAILNRGELVRVGPVRELTEDQHHYSITIKSDLPEAVRVQWEATRRSFLLEDGVLTLAVENVVELNQIIDHLRAQGVLIESISVKKSSLEDYFITVVQEQHP